MLSSPLRTSWVATVAHLEKEQIGNKQLHLRGEADRERKRYNERQPSR